MSEAQNSQIIHPKYSVNSIFGMILISISFVALYGIVNHQFFTPKIAYVDTSKLMVAFSDAAKVEKELKAADDKWRDQLKVLQDSLDVAIKTMTKEYNTATLAHKKELQDRLAVQNQQINNFKNANMKKIDELRGQKMPTVISKINAYLGEYGKSHHYKLILGSTNMGNILYGDQSVDITDQLIKGLNERYK